MFQNIFEITFNTTVKYSAGPITKCPLFAITLTWFLSLCTVTRHTCTTNQSSIITMPAAACDHSQATAGAVYQPSLSTRAQNIVQQNPPRSLTKHGIVDGCGIGGLEAKLPASNACISSCPGGVANSSPSLVDTDFNTAFTDLGAVDKSDVTVLTECCNSITIVLVIMLPTLCAYKCVTYVLQCCIGRRHLVHVCNLRPWHHRCR